MIAKKADVTQIFVFTLSAIIVALILSFGYSAIAGLSNTAQDIEFVQLKTDLQKEITVISADYGSFKYEEFAVPGKFTSVCFAELDVQSWESYRIAIDAAKAQKTLDDLSYAVIRDSLFFDAAAGTTQARKNLFLVPSGTDSLFIANMKVNGDPLAVSSDLPDFSSSPFFCAPVRAGRISIKLEGLGKGTRVSPRE